MSRITLALTLTIASFSASAHFTSGNELAEWLRESESSPESRYHTGLFRGFVSGVVDAGNKVAFCTGEGVTRGQFVAVVAKFVKEHPELWNHAADEIVTEAMRASFPCRRSQ
jgi:hypothetical protein